MFKLFKPLHLFLFVAFVYLNVQFTFKKAGQLLVSDSILGHLEVLDVNYGHGAVRLLRINNIVQTEMELATKHSASKYVRIIDTLIPQAGTQQSALVLGLGGGLTANLLTRKHYATDGVELDERIIEVAKNYFYLDPKVNAVYADARYFLNHCTKRYSLVLADVFKAEEQPSHILTKESLLQLKNNLADGALLLINWHGYNREEKGKGTAILYNTLRAAGFYIKLCASSANEDQRNLIFVASLQPLPPLPYGIKELVASTGRVNTDDLPLLEKYNALANKAWRANYLRYYQKGAY